MILEQDSWICPETPEWMPLENAIGVDSTEIKYFMFCGIVICTDGIRIMIYKHSVTRRSLHIDPSGRFYRYDGRFKPRRYEEIDRETALRICFSS